MASHTYYLKNKEGVIFKICVYSSVKTAIQMTQRFQPEGTTLHGGPPEYRLIFRKKTTFKNKQKSRNPRKSRKSRIRAKDRDPMRDFIRSVNKNNKGMENG